MLEPVGVENGLVYRNDIDIDAVIRERSEKVDDLLSHEWTAEYIEQLRKQREVDMDGKPDHERKKVSGNWNGIVGEAVVRKLWKRVTDGDTAGVDEMDKNYKTDALGRLNVGGVEYAFLIQVKATSELRVGEMVMLYPANDKLVPIGVSRETAMSSVWEIDKNKNTRNGLLNVSKMADYSRIGVQRKVPLLVITGVGRAAFDLMEDVQSGVMDESFRSGLREGLKTEQQ